MSFPVDAFRRITESPNVVAMKDKPTGAPRPSAASLPW